MFVRSARFQTHSHEVHFLEENPATPLLEARLWRDYAGFVPEQCPMKLQRAVPNKTPQYTFNHVCDAGCMVVILRLERKTHFFFRQLITRQ